ncbi:hypothetical protein HanRHA438_Chr16g0787481 [Helianthus annuus]|nr:hypothetical protein HanRHA438_Chr16g0787481 [Helianthus annuus]
MPRDPANDMKHAEVRLNKISQWSILSLKRLTIVGAAKEVTRLRISSISFMAITLCSTFHGNVN